MFRNQRLMSFGLSSTKIHYNLSITKYNDLPGHYVKVHFELGRRFTTVDPGPKKVNKETRQEVSLMK